WDVSGDSPAPKWSVETETQINGPGVVTGAGVVVAVRNQPVDGTTLTLLDPTDGSTISQVDLDGKRSDAPLCTDGDVVVALTGPVAGQETSTGSVVAVEAGGDGLTIRWEHAFATEHDDPDHVSDREPSSPTMSGDRYVAHLGIAL